MAFLPYLHRVAEGGILTREQAYEAMSAILSGDVTPAQIAGLLVAIKMRGEVADEIVGFAQAMRRASVRITGLEDLQLLDTCGTGGDGVGTFNISTVTALVVAGAGVKVAKHGNRSASGVFGSADLLEALGAKIDKSPAEVAADIRDKGIGFLFALTHHPAMMHARAARTELKMRTVFNLLGPLTNPAGAQRQLIGAPSEMSARLMAEALTHLGTERAFVVHSVDGLDEISTTGSTIVFEVNGGEVSKHIWEPSDFGVKRARISELVPMGRAENITFAESVLNGESGPKRDIVLVNAAAALVLAGRTKDFKGGEVTKHIWEPSDFGVKRARISELVPMGRAENITFAESVLNGESGPKRDIVLVNAAAALVLAGRTKDFKGGMVLAGESISSGAALGRLVALRS